MLHHIDWGIIDYTEAWQKQEELFSEILRCKQQQLPTSNYLVFCEHPHVYTLGKSGDRENLLLDLIQLQAKDAVFVQTNRGGDITYHGPGQLVGYPIFDLENFGIGIKAYIEKLEESIIRLLACYGLEGARLQGAAGVWLDADTPQARKICAIGVRASRYVTMHGFALNVNTQMEYFNYINPCGFTDKGVTSLEKELGHRIDPDEVKQHLKTAIGQVFL